MTDLMIVFLVGWLYFTGVFILAQIKENNSLVDMAWGPGFVVLVWIKYLVYDGEMILLPILVSIWGLRLFYHIFRRNVGKPEDFRYVDMRNKWRGPQWINAYFKVFMFQGILCLIISSSFIFIEGASYDLNMIMVGMIIFAFGLSFEAIGDHQLKVFLKSRIDKKKVMKSGLWQYTRHPNYFGEATLWWGIYLMAVGYGSSVLTIISPITITFLVRFVSGVPLLEKRYANNEDFMKYKLTTPIFIPFIKKNDKK